MGQDGRQETLTSADDTRAGRIMDSRKASNWDRAPSLLSSCSSPPVEPKRHLISCSSRPSIRLTQIVASNGLRVEGDEEIVTRLSQLGDTDARRTADDASLVELLRPAVSGSRGGHEGTHEYGAKGSCRDAVSHFILSSFVGSSDEGRATRRTEHPAQHRVRMSGKKCWVNNESRVFHDQSESITRLVCCRCERYV